MQGEKTVRGRPEGRGGKKEWREGGRRLKRGKSLDCEK